MLETLTLDFDQFVFQRKLRHYFTDSSPIKVNVVIKINGVIVKDTATQKEIEYTFIADRSIKDTLHDIIDLCEKELYPKVTQEIESIRPLSLEDKKQYLIQGLSYEEIENKAKVKTLKSFYIARVSYPSMTLILKSLEGQTYLVRFHQPLIKVMKELLNLAPLARYAYISKNGDIKDITNNEVQSDID